MPFVIMILISAGWTIADCCGSGMLETMWLQAALWINNACGDGCDMILASLEAEASACLDCPPKADG